MTDAERDLLALFKSRSFKTGTFTLASGATSNYYIDGRMTAVHSAGAFLIGRVLFEHTRDLKIDAIGGLAVGAVPLTTAVVMHYHTNGRAIEGFWVRDKAKEHGAKKLVEGGVKPGDRVLVLDDVITTGGSSVKAVEAVREMGCEVVRVLALVDRLQGAEATFRAAGIDYRSVYTIRDFGIDVPGA
ncbi:MAG TPA: orotate phosphoribosyltransferase [Gemmataceae bacterium]|nr:orotate phosphoribosyltransferase [Gemmataceae bacterium]